MRVLVAGASGVLGRATTRALVARGHEVIGLARSAQRGALVAQDGGTPMTVEDALAPGALHAAVAATAPDAIVNQLSALPRDYQPREIAPYYERTSALRLEGSRALLDAARAYGVARVVAQSIAFVYAPRGDLVKQEAEQTYADAPEPLGPAIRAVLEMERLVMAADVSAVALRYGFLYGPGTHYTADGTIFQAVKKGTYPLIGDGAGVYSFVHVDDAAAATALAIESPVRGIVNVVDDAPVAMRDWLPALARRLGAGPPPRMDAGEAGQKISPAAVMMATQQRGAANERARALLGWTPRHRFVTEDEISARMPRSAPSGRR